MLQNISHMSGEGLLCRHLPPYRNSWAKAPALWEVGKGFVQPKQARALPQRVSHHRYPPVRLPRFPGSPHALRPGLG